MRFAILSVALAALSASAANVTVVVGGAAASPSLVYNPSNVKIENGDTVTFQFVAKNHTVTQSTFANPCTPMPGGVNSGYMAVAAGATQFPSWSFTVTNASAPLWFFCAQPGHCEKGMVFAINPTAEKSFATFQATAMGGAAAGGNSTGAGAGSGAGAGTGSGAGSTAGGNGTAAGAGAGNSTGTDAAGNGAESFRFSSLSAVAVSLALGSLLL